MSYEIKSDELKEIMTMALTVMRAARERTSNIRYDNQALEAANVVMRARRTDLVERLNAAKLKFAEEELNIDPDGVVIEGKTIEEKRELLVARLNSGRTK